MTNNITGFNLSYEAIGKQAKSTPNAPALEIIGPLLKNFPQQQWTYEQLDTSIRAIAGGLIKKAEGAGIHPGDFLLLRLNSDATFALTFFAAIAAGFVPIPLSPQLTDEELRFFMRDTEAKWAALAPNLTLPADSKLKTISDTKILSFMQTEPPASYHQTLEEDPAFLIYTSGTTSKPKGVLHAHRVIIGRRPMVKGWHQITANDRVLHAGDFNWTYTLGIGLMDPWAQGATALIYHGEKHSKLWPAIISENKVSIFAGVPGVYRQILKYGTPTRSQLKTLHHGLCAGEALSKELSNQWQQTTGIPLYEAMGQSEISTYVSTAPGIKVPSKAKGRIQQGRNIVILGKDTTNTTPLPANEVGLIAVHKSDPGMMLSYWRAEQEQAPHFRGPWFITGDLGSLDKANNLTHVGRKDEMLNASGYRVSPAEVETALLACPLIAEAAVYQQNMANNLAIISAAIVKNQNATQPDEQIIATIKAHLSEKIAPYKHPKQFIFIETLPKNKAGKLSRKLLKAHIEKQS